MKPAYVYAYISNTTEYICLQQEMFQTTGAEKN
jgi:hypothetical protein